MYDIAVLTVVLSVVAGGTAAAWLLARHDTDSSAFAFGIFLLVLTVWTATHLGSLFAESTKWLLFFSQLSYLGVVSAPLAWFVFALRYADRGEWLTWRRLGALSVVPLATLGFVFTVPVHDLFYTSVELSSVDGHPILETGSGPWHVVNVVYSYAVLLAGTVTLAGAALSSSRLYRRQSAVLLACITVPWIVNVNYHAGLRPIPWVDVTPMAFIVTGIPLAVVVVRTDLASFLPVAHERVFRSLADPMVIVAPSGKIIDANQAARSLFDRQTPIEGSHVSSVFPDTLLSGGDLREDLEGAVSCAIDGPGDSDQYLVRRQSVDPGEGVTRGSVFAFTDITERVERERELEALSERARRKNEQLERMADVVSHDMQTPVSTAEKLVELLRSDLDDGTLDGEVTQTFDTLEGVLGRLDSFADHIPRLAREATDVETVEDCDLETLAREAWGIVDTGPVDLEIEGSTTLEADRRRLLQVFENLFANSIEHGAHGASVQDQMPDGGADSQNRHGFAGEQTVTTVRVGTTDDGFYVTDDGPGIDPDRRDKIFEYGVSTGDGSGFGLAIVRTVVEAHGWEISVADPSEEASGDDHSGETSVRFEIQTTPQKADQS